MMLGQNGGGKGLACLGLGKVKMSKDVQMNGNAQNIYHHSLLE